MLLDFLFCLEFHLHKHVVSVIAQSTIKPRFGRRDWKMWALCSYKINHKMALRTSFGCNFATELKCCKTHLSIRVMGWFIFCRPSGCCPAVDHENVFDCLRCLVAQRTYGIRYDVSFVEVLSGAQSILSSTPKKILNFREGV